ncbi:MAG TPA: hypothetical protein VLA09_10875 [Longimicrobiales bacterium]|nr:hypothetical protein [Longimicrobiales bacterium]
MGRKGSRRQQGQRPAKGFRPGKEPAALKKQRAKAQLGSDATFLQKQTIEAIAGRSPQEVQAMVRRWSLGLFVGAALSVALGAFLYSWALWAGVVVHVLAAVLLFLGYRMRRQAPSLIEMAKSMR